MYPLNTVKLGREIGKKPDANKFIWAACEKCNTPRWVILLVADNKPVRYLCRTCAGLLRRGEKRGPAHNRLDLTGQKFSRLSVISFAGTQSNKRRESLWRCLCDCGKETIVNGYNLTSGMTKSCGCFKSTWIRQKLSKSYDEIQVNRVMDHYRNSARKKGHDFQLDRETFRILINADCYYCGAKPGNKWIVGVKEIVYQGIDRLDNPKGYVPGNVVPCCIVCNKMKKAKDSDQFVTHAHTISARFEGVPSQADFYYETCGGYVL